MEKCVHPHTHTCAHTYTCTCICGLTPHTPSPTHIEDSPIQLYVEMHTCMCLCTLAQVCVCKHMHTYTHISTCTYLHAYTLHSSAIMGEEKISSTPPGSKMKQHKNNRKKEKKYKKGKEVWDRTHNLPGATTHPHHWARHRRLLERGLQAR